MDQRTREYLRAHGAFIISHRLPVFQPQPVIIAGATLYLQSLRQAGCGIVRLDRIRPAGLYGLNIGAAEPSELHLLLGGVMAEVPVTHGRKMIAVLVVGARRAERAHRSEE